MSHWQYQQIVTETATSTKTEEKEQERAAVTIETVTKETYLGIYKETLPCADCEGIQTVLTLNADDCYTLESVV